MVLTVVSQRPGKPAVKRAEVAVVGDQVKILANQQAVVDLIKALLPIPTRLKTRDGDKVVKTWPPDAESSLAATLKQNLHDPYRLARAGEAVNSEGFSGSCRESLPASVLSGEERHVTA
ncbi:MAG: hypothetical protein ABFE07_29115 [Armatimonadia bacterium]